jgi:hypothetical protein
MYNPVNMQIEDEKRLLEKDIRDKNKKKRFEVRYDADQLTKDEGVAEDTRLDDMALKRMSYKHSHVQVNRGFNILSNGELPESLKIIKDNK